MNHKDVFQHLVTKEAKLCVLSTCDHTGNPESAVVGYAVRGNLEIVVSTRVVTRKWKNVEKQNKVALVIGWDFQDLSIQYEGSARLVMPGDAKEKETETFFFTQNPNAKQFKTDDTGYVVISPTWIRVTDPSVHPPAIKELTDFS